MGAITVTYKCGHEYKWADTRLAKAYADQHGEELCPDCAAGLKVGQAIHVYAQGDLVCSGKILSIKHGVADGIPSRSITIGAFLLLAVLLSGCVGDQSSKQNVNFDRSTAQPVPPSTGSGQANSPVDSVDRGGLGGRVAELSSSQNATQQSLTGLGVQLGKLGDRVEGIHADMSARLDAAVNANANLRAELSATATANATLSAKATADLRAEFSNRIEAQATAIADLKAQLTVQAAAVAGVGNRVESVATTSQATAGRDAISFTPEMARMFVTMNSDFRAEQASQARWFYLMLALCTGAGGGAGGVLTHWLHSRISSPRRRGDAEKDETATAKGR